MKTAKKSTKTQLKRKADKLFADRIKEVGFCYRCGTNYNLQCAHIISRSYLATRWNLQNALCLCAGCHLYYTYHPLEWEDYIDDNFPGRYDELKQLALTHQKPDYEELIASLKNE